MVQSQTISSELVTKHFSYGHRQWMALYVSIEVVQVASLLVVGKQR
jgi:hypothetical protein